MAMLFKSLEIFMMLKNSPNWKPPSRLESDGVDVASEFAAGQLLPKLSPFFQLAPPRAQKFG
jgi:hypothetical protein